VKESVQHCIIIGGGIVGLSTAWQLQQRCKNKRILLLEKEDGLAHHQTGHNSGVIHAGVYYEPGSLKARFCKEGAASTYAFCRENGIPFEQCGKLLVATDEREMRRMGELFERCKANGLDPQWWSAGQLRRTEPHISGLGAFLVRESGIVDFPAICRKMADKFRAAGGEIRLGTEVSGIKENPDSVVVETDQGRFQAGQLVVCAGLMADRLAAMQGITSSTRSRIRRCRFSACI
jgi:L-2-hydroxyglutarate oxidase